jgi:ribonuclease Z
LDSSSEYPPGRGRVRIEAAGIEIEGVSVAGHESFYKLPGLRVLLDFGRAPEDTVSYETIFLSHGHLDHAAGLAHHASRRRLAGLRAARVYLPEQAIEDVGCWLAASERLEGVSYSVELLPARPGESIPLRRDLEVRFLPGRHRVPSVGYLINEVRHKLRDEHAGRPGAEIAALRARGVEVTRREETPLLAYPGDCGAEIFEAAPEIFTARVLLIECSFLLPEDVERARRYAHLHLQDFLERADLFRNEAIVLTHFSQRYLPHEIRSALEELPPRFAAKVIPFLPPDAG